MQPGQGSIDGQCCNRQRDPAALRPAAGTIARTPAPGLSLLVCDKQIDSGLLVLRDQSFASALPIHPLRAAGLSRRQRRRHRHHCLWSHKKTRAGRLHWQRRTPPARLTDSREALPLYSPVAASAHEHPPCLPADIADLPAQARGRGAACGAGRYGWVTIPAFAAFLKKHPNGCFFFAFFQPFNIAPRRTCREYRRAGRPSLAACPVANRGARPRSLASNGHLI